MLFPGPDGFVWQKYDAKLQESNTTVMDGDTSKLQESNVTIHVLSINADQERSFYQGSCIIVIKLQGSFNIPIASPD